MMLYYFNHLLYLRKSDPLKLFKVNHISRHILQSTVQVYRGLYPSSCVGCTSAPIVVRCSFPLLCQVQGWATYMQLWTTWYPYHWLFCTKVVAEWMHFIVLFPEDIYSKGRWTHSCHCHCRYLGISKSKRKKNRRLCWSMLLGSSLGYVRQWELLVALCGQMDVQ